MHSFVISMNGDATYTFLLGKQVYERKCFRLFIFNEPNLKIMIEYDTHQHFKLTHVNKLKNNTVYIKLKWY
jgi:hypothetical protein